MIDLKRKNTSSLTVFALNMALGSFFVIKQNLKFLSSEFGARRLRLLRKTCIAGQLNRPKCGEARENVQFFWNSSGSSSFYRLPGLVRILLVRDPKDVQDISWHLEGEREPFPAQF